MRRAELDTKEDTERGWALVSVLWVVLILSMLAAGLEALTLTAARIEHRAEERAQIEAALDAGVTRGVLGLLAPSRANRWPVDGTSEPFTFAGYAMQVRLQDEFGRIDLNAADESVLRQLLSDAGLSAEDAAALTDKILDWRSPGDLHRLHGATDADYAAAGFSYQQRHGPFQSVEELKLVLGMTPALFAKIAPTLTVYNRRPTIDPAVAPREALLAYYGGNRETVERMMAARQANEASSPAILDPSLSPSGRAFTITVALQSGMQHFERRTVVELTGDDRRPYLVLAWR